MHSMVQQSITAAWCGDEGRGEDESVVRVGFRVRVGMGVVVGVALPVRRYMEDIWKEFLTVVGAWPSSQ